MNISYLLNILDLYLLKESKSSLIVEISKMDNIIKVDFSYLSSYVNKTFVKLSEKEFFDNLKDILNKIQDNALVISEDYTNDVYKLNLDNERQISFIDFDIETLENIRNEFKNLNTEFIFKKEEEPITYSDMYKENRELRPSFSFGFSTIITIFLISIWFLDIFMIALWIFKATR